MQNATTTTLVRDCAATKIPSGEQIILPGGTEVDITQNLGGSYTVHIEGGLFRIAEQDSDALGVQKENGAPPAPALGGQVDEALVMNVLRNCYDPEIPVNIVDLGLVYDVAIESLADGKNLVAVKMTLTAQGCGMGGAIAGDAQRKLLEVPGIEMAHVEIVWDPPWNPAMITEAGKKILGIE